MNFIELKEKLKEEFNGSKINSNERLIMKIIEILNEDDEQYKTAMQILQDKEKEVELKSKELSKKEKELNYLKNKTEESIKRLTELKEATDECETAEARDRIRIADYFVEKTSERKDEEYINGLSNILTNAKLKE